MHNGRQQVKVERMKYKTIYKIAVFLLFISFFFIIATIFLLSKEFTLGRWEWLLYGGGFILFSSGLVIFLFRQESSENLRLNYQERKIAEDLEKLQQLQKEFQSKQSLLNQKETEVKQKLIQYQQYFEFPDEYEYQGDKNNQASDQQVAQLLQQRAEIIFDKIVNKKYSENKNFKNELLLDDIVDLIESVARIHHPESQHPLMETSVENLLRSLNRLSLQLLVLVDSFPINIKEYNLRKTYLYIQKSANTIGYYKKAEPFLTFVTPVLRIGMAANPMIGIAQTVAIEAGKHAIKKGSEKYALNLLHDVIEIIGEQATTIFGDDSSRYRRSDWIFALEITEIVRHFTPVQAEALSKALKIISGLLMSSEYDRVFIYHCLTQGITANPEKFDYQFISSEERQKIADKLSDFVEQQINKQRSDETDKRVVAWRQKTESRLGVKIQLNIDKNDAEYLRNMLSSGSPEKKVKPFLARYILAMMREGETPQFIYTDIHVEPVAKSADLQELWLLGSNRRLILLNVAGKKNKDNISLCWSYDSEQKQRLSLQRMPHLVADDCKVSGGLWQAEDEMEFIILGRKTSGYDSYFQALEDFKRVLS